MFRVPRWYKTKAMDWPHCPEHGRFTAGCAGRVAAVDEAYPAPKPRALPPIVAAWLAEVRARPPGVDAALIWAAIRRILGADRPDLN